MSVVLPNATVTARVRPHPAARDRHGMPVLGGPVVVRGPFPAGVKERPDSGSWSLRLDPRLWPLRDGDEVTDGTRVWVLFGTPELHQLTGISTIDYVAAQGTLDPSRVP